MTITPEEIAATTPEKALEAAAIVSWEFSCPAYRWAEITEPDRQHHRKKAKAIIDAYQRQCEEEFVESLFAERAREQS